MEEHAVQLCFYTTGKSACVFSYPVDTNIDIGRNRHPWFVQWKCDDIGIEVMVEVGLVDLKHTRVCGENIINGFDAFSFPLGNA